MQPSLSLEIAIKTFDDMPVGVGIFRVNDLNDIKSIEYVFMNKVLLFEMRKEKEEVFGKKIIEIAPEAYEHEAGLKVIETYRKVASEGGVVNLGLVEYSNHLVAGIYECSVHYIMDNYVYVMLRNVSELEKTKNELEQRNKELSEFSYIVSHDLKEPLNTILGVINLVEDQYQGKLDKQGGNLLKVISDSTQRMRSLVNDLLDYGSIGKQRKMTLVDCNKLIREILQDLDASIKETATEITINELPKIKCLETELRLLFQNLICNGIKFCKPDVPPKISISATKQKGWTFSIQDNGIGIADGHKQKIFNVFQRLHDKSEYEGTGIGLAHCKKIVELHHGNIWIDSKVGEGSTFYFNLPD